MIETNKQILNQSYVFVILVAIIFFAVGLVLGYIVFGNNNKQVFNTITPPAPTQPQSISVTPAITANTSNLKKYENTAYNFSFSYPMDLNLQEAEDKHYVLLSSQPIIGLPSDEISYQVSVMNESREFNPLIVATEGMDVPEAHNAVSTIVKKMQNTQIRNYQAVSYFLDGISSPEEKNRGPIGYEYITLIKLREDRYIRILTSSFDKNTLEKQKKIYDAIIESFEFK